MSKTEIIETNLKLPKPIHDFYTALAKSENTVIENLLVKELIADAETILENQDERMTSMLKNYFDLEKVFEG